MSKSTPKKTNNPTQNEVLPIDEQTSSPIKIIVEHAQALKLSPKTVNHVFYQLGVNEIEKTVHIRMSGNEGGGLHSKKWVSLNHIIALLDEYQTTSDTPKEIKSIVLKPAFTGGSSNNSGFMAAILRDDAIGLLRATDKGVFLHCLNTNYEDNKARLLALIDSEILQKPITEGQNDEGSVSEDSPHNDNEAPHH